MCTYSCGGCGCCGDQCWGAKGVKHARAAVTRSIVEALKETGTRRLAIQSSLGAGDSGRQLPVLLAKPWANHNGQEAAVRDSGLDWAIVRPTGLKNASALGMWRAHEVSDGKLWVEPSPRADLAAFLMEVVADDSAIGKAFDVSS